MKQNKYDEPEFFAEYSQMPRSIHGLAAGLEWTTFQALLPDVRNKRVLDLGCGFGWHCRYAQEHGAHNVVGIDLSVKMLERAHASTHTAGIEYLRCAIEDIDFAANQFDVVISSLALHYVESFDRVCQKVHHCLTPNGMFLFSVEHPIFTTLPAQSWLSRPERRTSILARRQLPRRRTPPNKLVNRERYQISQNTRNLRQHPNRLRLPAKETRRTKTTLRHNRSGHPRPIPPPRIPSDRRDQRTMRNSGGDTLSILAPKHRTKD